MRPLASRGKVLTAAFLAVIAISVVAAWSDWTLLDYLKGIASGGAVDKMKAEAIDSRQALIGLAQVGLFVVCAIAFFVWIHRAYANLVGGGLRNLKFTPGWAVGWFFVPIVNLVRPYAVMSEIWKGSVFLSTPTNLDSWERVPRHPLVLFWWLMYLVSSVLGRMAGSAMAGAKELPTLIDSTNLTLASDAVEIVAAFLGLALVLRVTRMQEKALLEPAVARAFE